jgi:hypothetical protein
MKPLTILFVSLFVAGNLFAARPEPQKQVDAFLYGISEKGATWALEDLCKGTLLDGSKDNELMTGAPQIDALFKIFGKVARTENIEKKPIGDSLLRFRLISYSETGLPLFWEFIPQGERRMAGLRFSIQC